MANKTGKLKILMLFFAMILITTSLHEPTEAALLTYTSDTLSNPIVGSGSNHTIEFISPSGVDAGESIILQFNPGFFINLVDYTDIDVSDNGADLTLAATSSGETWGASFLGNTLSISSDTGTIAPGHTIIVEIGTHATFQATGDRQIVNPSIEGRYGIVVSGTFGDNGSCAVYVMEDNSMTVSATVLGYPKVNIQWAVPQLRVGGFEKNDDATFFITILSPDDNDDTVIFTQSNLATTTVAGVNLEYIELTGLASSTYDVGIKTHQHLTKKLDNIMIHNGPNTLNFSTLDNSVPKGSEVLLAGDVNGAGTSPATLGDDVVNSIDLSIILSDLDDIDFDGNQIRSNLNQDTVVNSVDLSIMIANLDKEGEK